MNRYIFLVIFLSSVHLAAQEAPEWAMEGALWHYTYLSLPYEVKYLTLEVKGDSLLNDTTCRVLKPRLYGQSGEENTELAPICLRQEGRRIYYWVKNRFTLLYDFDALVGDTIEIIAPITQYEDDSVMYFRVDSVGEVEIDGKTLRSQYLVPIEKGAAGYSVQFSEWNIELIGNSYYMLPINQLYCDSECPISLRCYGDQMISKKVVIPCDTTDFLIATRNANSYGFQHKYFPRSGT
ncbi:MAG: hypothetical protein KDC80_11845 [Saprospiraceae bacterium]|nr:hypothetical protein [Saprospiraceae bacterium]